MTDFEFQEDAEYFEQLFSDSGMSDFKKEYFDFRDPDIKRAEFGKIRDSVFETLKEKYGNVCQLEYSDDCTAQAEQVDHIIPLHTNVLNKQLRKIKELTGKKTPSQSFGSNKMCNFALACARCNGRKKHRILTAEEFVAVLGRL